MIRKANKNDIIKINKLGEQLHNNFNKLFHIETEIDSNLAIVLVNDGDLGINAYLYALDLGDNIDLLSIFVDNNYRNQKIGTSMLKYLIQANPNKSITLEVNENNIAAIALYQKLDFKIVGKRAKYYNNEDAYVMKWGK